jgi:IclR family transcriptional regulator, acetate operon repressor
MGNVQSVERAVAILRCLADGEAGVTQIAGTVNLPKSTVSRLLSTLHDLGAVTAIDGGYRIGPLLTELATGAAQHHGLITLATPFLESLVEMSGEDAGLSVLDQDTTLYLAQVGAAGEVQMRDWTGEQVPPHCVSSGLVLLAYSPIEVQRRILAGPLRRLTVRTVVAPSKIRRRLSSIVRRGSEWVYGEFADDINSVAAPVLGRDGHALAALHLHGPSYRFPGRHDPDLIAAQVTAAAQQMSDKLP